MTYRHSFLLTAENLIDFDFSDTDKGIDLRAVMANSSPAITNGVSASETGDITSLFYMKKEVERLKGVLKEEKEKNDVQLECKNLHDAYSGLA